MAPALVVVPRWGGEASSDFYPWLRAELGDRVASFTVAPLVPDPYAPRVAGTRASVAAAMERAGEPLVLLGHSVGCQAVLHALGAWQGARPTAALLVAGWWSVDEPWPSLLPWLSPPADLARVRSRCDRWQVLLSDDDPFTADHLANAVQWKRHLGAPVRVVNGARHFNRPEEPAVLEALLSAVE